MAERLGVSPGGRPARPRRHRAVDVVGAVVAALLAFTAVPAVLVFVVGNPLSGGLGHSWQPATRDALCALALAAWIAWAACTSQLVRGVVAHVRRGEVRPVGVMSPLDRVAARIAVGVLALSTVGTPLVLASGAGATTAQGGAGTAVVAVAARTAPTAPDAAPSPVHTVQPG
ncbi:MAG TPA: hypothetical protein VK773_14230, partial [Acidimicrobiales bacterium]|nr:hypothetical protein [Acidimicrobiales bacterium]